MVGEEAKLKIMLVAVLEENHNVVYVLFKELTNQGEERDRAEIRGGGRVTFYEICENFHDWPDLIDRF